MHTILKRARKLVKYVRVVPRRKLRNRFKKHKHLTLKQACAEIQKFQRLPPNSAKRHIKEMNFFVQHFAGEYLAQFISKFGLNKSSKGAIDSALLAVENLPQPKRNWEFNKLLRLANDAWVDLEKLENHIQRIAFSRDAVVHYQVEAGELRHFILNMTSMLGMNVDLVRQRINDII